MDGFIDFIFVPRRPEIKMQKSDIEILVNFSPILSWLYRETKIIVSQLNLSFGVRSVLTYF